MRLTLLLLCTLLSAAGLSAQDMPTIAPSVVYTGAAGEETTEPQYSGSAPISAAFRLNPQHTDGWTAHYEWRLYREGKEEEPYLIRYEEDMDYTFTESGMHFCVCYATFTRGEERVEYTEDYWRDARFGISVFESKLEMPNAFSPNGDGINDVYRAKPGYQSIVEFQATILNRWGQKVYSWTDPAGGWDGTWHGSDVAQGVYFCLVKARGADGRRFNIRKDVNLLRGFTEREGSGQY